MGNEEPVLQLREKLRRLRERLDAEVAKRRHVEEKFATVFNSNAGLMAICTIEEGRMIDVNDFFLDALGFRRDEVIGKTSAELGLFRNPQRRGEVIDELRAQGARGAVRDREVVVCTRSGEQRRALLSAELITLQDRPLLLTVMTDITERKRAEDALRQSEERLRASEERYRTLYNNAQVGLSRTRVSDGKLVACNRKYATMCGYDSIEECISDYVTSEHYVDPTLREEIGVLLKERGEISDVEAHVTKRDGTQLWVSYSAKLTPDGSAADGVAYEITERKHAEEALRQSEERYRAITETALDSIFCKDLDSKYTFVNPAMERVFGRPASELRGLTPRDLFDEESAAIVEAVDSSVFLGEVSNAIRTLKIQSEERTFHTIQVPLRDAAGEVAGICGIVRDITERKRAEEERRQLEAQVLQSQKLESLGVLAGGIAHDFNNILVGLLGNADLALSSIPSSSPARLHLRGIQQASRQAADLTSQMLAYSGKGGFAIEDIDINALLRDMSSLLESATSKKVELTYQLATELPAIRADATQVRQIVLNLVRNASEAIGAEVGVVRLRTDTTDCSRAFLDAVSPDAELAEGRYVTFEVTDTGCGMDEETKAKIFDPFFSSKFTGRGLGLAAVQGIMRGHKGAILVESEPRKGTTFELFFPALDHPAEAVATRTTEENAWHGKGTILLVDDEEMVRKVSARMLKRVGFSVLTAADGVEAVESFREHHDEIACVLLDLKMPRMDGEEAFEEMRKIKGDVAVILSSGYGEQESIKRFGGKGLAGFLKKPYEVKDLKEMLRKVLSD